MGQKIEAGVDEVCRVHVGTDLEMPAVIRSMHMAEEIDDREERTGFEWAVHGLGKPVPPDEAQPIAQRIAAPGDRSEIRRRKIDHQPGIPGFDVLCRPAASAWQDAVIGVRLEPGEIKGDAVSFRGEADLERAAANIGPGDTGIRGMSRTVISR